MRILIVEDDPAVSRFLEKLLKKLGHDVDAASTGPQAWEMFEREHFPLVVSDWLMPDIDGLELCRRIRETRRERYTYFILVTGLGGKQNYLEGMNAGADDFIVKPVDPDQFAARLRVAERILGLQAEVKQLQGLLPICAYCKKIRDEHDRWTRIEEYISQRTDAIFSHSLCPDCYHGRVKPEVARLIDRVLSERQTRAG